MIVLLPARARVIARNNEAEDDTHGLLASHILNPQQARILPSPGGPGPVPPLQLTGFRVYEIILLRGLSAVWHV